MKRRTCPSHLIAALTTLSMLLTSLGGCPSATDVGVAKDVVGAQGPAGPAGPRGESGLPGPAGSPGERGLQGPAGAPGANGTNGTDGKDGADGTDGANGIDGADGQLRIYGDGSAGALTVSSNAVLLGSIATDGNLQFTDFTVNAGVTLSVPSGAVIRCTGTFTNNGVIDVFAAARGGRVGCNGNCDSADAVPIVQPADSGVSLSPAGMGEFGDASVQRIGGNGGRGLGQSSALLLLNPGPKGGGGGMGSSAGGSGGGTLVVLAEQAIVNASTGIFRANGEAPGITGTAGGGGGIVVLASPGSITQSGRIDAKGGAGSAAGSAIGPGGGGGGGIVHFLSPSVPIRAGVSVAGGAGGAGTPAGSLTAAIRSGGGAGGACGGNGGDGGSANQDGSTFSANSGQNGFFIVTLVNPTSLF
ncbi:MAG: hypothetical protein U1D55_13010 [Phycisphaerae bacterium]